MKAFTTTIHAIKTVQAWILSATAFAGQALIILIILDAANAGDQSEQPSQQPIKMEQCK